MTVLGGLPVRVMFAAHDDGEPDGWMVDAITGYCSVKTGKPLGKWVRPSLLKKVDDLRLREKMEDLR